MSLDAEMILLYISVALQLHFGAAWGEKNKQKKERYSYESLGHCASRRLLQGA